MTEGWNKRVVRHEDGSLAVHNVHTAPDGRVVGWSNRCSEAIDPEDDIDGLRCALDHTYATSIAALDEPIIDVGDLP